MRITEMSLQIPNLNTHGEQVNKIIDKLIYYMYINKSMSKFQDKETLLYFKNTYTTVNKQYIDKTYSIVLRTNFMTDDEKEKFFDIINQIREKKIFNYRWFDWVSNKSIYLHTKIFFEPISKELFQLVSLFVDSLFRHNLEQIEMEVN
jgi:Cdc6-like AAA superfamily ATPase